MITSIHIDWFSCTTKQPEIIREKFHDSPAYWLEGGLNRLVGITGNWRPSGGHFGYKVGYTHGSGLQVLMGTQGMGIHCIYSAQALQQLGMRHDFWPDSVIRWWRGKAQATRVDIALDLIDGNASVQSFVSALKAGLARTAAKKWRVMQNSESGHTVYIGSRTSERMLRIYNKKAERAAAFEDVEHENWIRVEVELKGDRAKAFLNGCIDNSIDDVILATLLDACNFPSIQDWKQATSAIMTVYTPEKTKRKDTKTRHWLKNVIAPVLARETLHDIEFLADFENEVARQREELRRQKPDTSADTGD